MVGVVEEDRINHGTTTSMNGQASRSHHCCASWMTEVNGQSSQWRHLSKCPSDARVSQILVGYLNEQP